MQRRSAIDFNLPEDHVEQAVMSRWPGVRTALRV